MTMSKVNAHNIADIIHSTCNTNNNNNNNKNKNKNYYNNKCGHRSDSRIYEVVEAKKCIQTQIYVQTQLEGETRISSNSNRRRKRKYRTCNISSQGAETAGTYAADAQHETVMYAGKLRQTWRRISSRTCCSIDASLWHDAAFRIIAMLFVAALLISGAVEVSAAHRNIHKHQNTNGISKNVNEIPFGFNDLVSSNGNTNTNTFDYANTLAMSTTNIVSDSSAMGSVSFSTISATASSLLSSVAGMEIPSGSLQKVNSVANGASGKGANRNSIEITDEQRNSGPYFDKAASKNVTALLGKTVYLNCRVKNLGNKTMLLQVSWVRHRDIHLLTVGRYTYTSDQRFRAIHQPQTEDWLLQIKYPQHRDSGIYECQVSTTPHMSHYIHLNVVEPSTEIIGAPDLYIESGSTINLTCVIWNSPEPPAYIFWNHNNAIINYDSPRGGVSVVTLKGETTTSFLLIKSAHPSDSGLYQCNPSNAKPKSVTVHVLNGEFPAAMQHAAPSQQQMTPNRILFVYLLSYLFTVAYCKR